MICSELGLLEYVRRVKGSYSAIIVEGYDGVGKGRVLSVLSEMLGVVPYRPDYEFWQSHGLSKGDRWKMSGFFWDIFSHFFSESKDQKVMLFDRGMLSGAVYGSDFSIIRDYKKITRGMSILHILVICDKKDYVQFQKVRGGISDEEIENGWLEYVAHTESYKMALECSLSSYITYKNKFSRELSDTLLRTCAGCGHFSHGWCRHPVVNCEVNSNQRRCDYSFDKEVQDVNDYEVSEMSRV